MAIKAELHNKLMEAGDVIIGGSGSSQSNLTKLKTDADDLVTDVTYLDISDNKRRRIDTITYSSVSLALSVTETYTYGTQDSRNYYITKITLS